VLLVHGEQGSAKSTGIESVQLSYLTVVMGTSVRELEDTYFRWLKRTDEQLLELFDAYDAAPTL
jgi:hypothetical protein